MLVIFLFILLELLILSLVLLIWNQLLSFYLTGVSLLDDSKFALTIYDITNIVNALEVYVLNERELAISENRDFDRGIQATLSYLRDYENFLKRSEAKYVTLSHSI